MKFDFTYLNDLVVLGVGHQRQHKYHCNSGRWVWYASVYPWQFFISSSVWVFFFFAIFPIGFRWKPAMPSVWYSVGPCLIFCTVQLHFLGKVKFDWVLMIFVFCLVLSVWWSQTHTYCKTLVIYLSEILMKCFWAQQLFTNRLWTEGIKFSKINNYMQGNIYTLSPYSCYLPLNIIKG